MLRKSAPMFLALALAACASYDGRTLPPGASEAEVRGLMGAPALEVPLEGGGKRLAYPKGPLGVETFMADLAPDGRLVQVRNVLNDGTFDSMRAGITEQDVLRMIGPPNRSMNFPMSNTHAWEYRYMDTWGYISEFSVTFDANGVMVSKLKRRLERSFDKR